MTNIRAHWTLSKSSSMNPEVRISAITLAYFNYIFPMCSDQETKLQLLLQCRGTRSMNLPEESSGSLRIFCVQESQFGCYQRVRQNSYRMPNCELWSNGARMSPVARPRSQAR